MEKKFKLEFLNEAIDFKEDLDIKTRTKVYYNARKAQITNSLNCLKNSMRTFGNSGQNIIKIIIDYWRFGIKPIKLKL